MFEEPTRTHRREEPGLVGLVTGVVIIVVMVVIGIVWLIGSSNPQTPAGYVGYLTKGAVFGQARFYGLQTGPTSPGRTWLLSVTNVSVTPYTYMEEFKDNTAVLSKDNLMISFQVQVVWRIRATDIRNFMEHYSVLISVTDLDKDPDVIVRKAYDNFVHAPLRTFARDEIQKYSGLTIKDNIQIVGRNIHDQIITLTRETPYEILQTVVSNIQYPLEVSKSVSEKLAATQVLERKATEIEIQRRDAEKRIVEAEGIAKAMEIINQRLTPTYIQHEAIEAQKAMVGSPNHTTVYIPVGPMGVPLVGTMDVGAKKVPESKQ